MIIASGKFGIGVIKKLCQRVHDGKGMPEEWKTSVVVPIFKGIRDVMDSGAYREVKLLEHTMKIAERVLENRIRGLVTTDDMQVGLMPGKGTIYALFILSYCKNARGVLRKRAKAVHVFCGLRKGI